MRNRSVIGFLLVGILLFAQLINLKVNAQTSAVNSEEIAHRIKNEETNNSQFMDTLSYLIEVIGPRLTNSPNFRKAATWSKDKLTSMGLQNAHFEQWGPFGRGWSMQHFSAQVIEPQSIPLIAVPKAWSPLTKGELVSDVVYIDASNEADLQKYKGKLKGKIVLLTRPLPVEAHFTPTSTRWTDEEMLKYADDELYPPDNPLLAPPPTQDQIAAAKFSAIRNLFVYNEDPALLLEPSREGDGGTIQVQSASIPYSPDTPRNKRATAWDPNAPKIIPQVVVAVEQYNRMVRMVQHGLNLKMAVDLKAQYNSEDLMSTHTIAEIPGTDLKDEVVMIGAHLDSWHAGTGATDNGAGVALMMEVVRLFQTLKLQPRRTIRIALWGGEEEAAGSRYYVGQHFGHWDRTSNPPRLITTPEYDKLSAYYNFDAGTGKVRGFFLAGNEALRRYFARGSNRLRIWARPR